MAARSRRRLPRLFGFALVLALAAPALDARAQAPSAEGQAEARRSAAKQKFDQGVTAYKERRYEDAARLFQEADAIEPSTSLSFNVARAFEKLDDTSGALRWYRDFLRRSPQASNAAEVRAKVTALAATLSQAGVQQLSVLSDPAGATVLLDEQNVGVTPVTRDIAPGKHRLLLRLAGYAEKTADIALEPQTPQDVSLKLQPASANASRRDSLSASADSSADHRPRFGIVPYVAIGAGAASLLGALGFELARRSADSAAEDAPQTEFQGHYDTMQGRQTAARVLAGVGGALLATGGVMLVVDMQRKPSSAQRDRRNRQGRLPQVALGCDGDRCSFVAKGSFR